MAFSADWNDRIVVANNPVNFVDPEGLRNEYLDNPGQGSIGTFPWPLLTLPILKNPTSPPYEGPPGEYVEGPRKGRKYGPDGKPEYDIDQPHQGMPEPHVHEWPNGEREHPGRPVSPWPRQCQQK